MKTEIIPLEYDYFDYLGQNYIRIIGRNLKGKRICVVDNCDVFLWAILNEGIKEKKIQKLIEKIKTIQLDTKGRETKVEKVEIKQKKFVDKSVTALKIYATNYKDLHDVANELDYPEISKRRGYDLGFISHYINEKKIYPFQWYEIEGEEISNAYDFGKIGLALDVDYCINLKNHKEIKQEKPFEPKVLAYDIETTNFKIGEGEILMISLKSKNFEKVITWKKIKNPPKFVEYVEDEADLLERFTQLVREISPDFLVGYYSDGFDLPYLKARAEKNNVKLSLGLDDSQPTFSRGNVLIGKIKGIIHIDIFKFIRVAYGQYMKSESFSLNEVAKEFLSDKKEIFQIENSKKTEETYWEDFYRYNLQDAELTLGLFNKFFPDIIEFCKITKEPPFDITRAGISKLLESYILHNLEKQNEIPEKRPTHKELSERKREGPVEGAFVLEPKPGLYENIVMFDFTSMHTSIIISMNLSKGTLLEKKEKNATTIATKSGTFSFTKKEGFLARLFQELFEKRIMFKEAHKKKPNTLTLARSNAFKVLSAAIHGYIAFFGARYFSKETSSAILAFVRKFQKEIMDKTEKEGFEVIFGDTDSIGFTQKGKTKEEILLFLKRLNDELPGIMKLELEGFFKRGLFVTTRSGKAGAKKKYALMNEKGELKIRGFETVRRDWCNLSRKLQNQTLLSVLKDGNEKEAVKHIKDILKKKNEGKNEQNDLLIKTQLRKHLKEYKTLGPHVAAAKRMIEKEIPVSQGNIIQYYIA